MASHMVTVSKSQLMAPLTMETGKQVNDKELEPNLKLVAKNNKVSGKTTSLLVNKTLNKYQKVVKVKW
jgi:hypothetical protein